MEAHTSLTGSRSVDLMIGYGEPCDYLKIPNTWLEKILSPNGTCNMVACAVLAQIKFAYRPKLLTDGTYGKYFSGDVFRISYDELASKVHQTKCSVRNACTFLEDIGLIKRIFRTVILGGVRQSNVLFIDLCVENLLKLEGDCEKYISVNNQNAEEAQDIADVSGPVLDACESDDGYLSTKLSTGMDQKCGTKDNKILINNTINNYISPSNPDHSNNLSGVRESLEAERVVKENIDYHKLCRTFPDAVFLVDKAVHESAVALTVKKSFALSSSRIISPCDARNIFGQLTYSDLDKVLSAAISNLDGIKSLKFYIRTSLYEEVLRRTVQEKVVLKKSGYRDFMQNTYDFEDLERRLIAN